MKHTKFCVVIYHKYNYIILNEILVTGQQLKYDSGTKLRGYCVNDTNFRDYFTLCEMIGWLCMNRKDGEGNNNSLLEVIITHC